MGGAKADVKSKYAEPKAPLEPKLLTDKDVKEIRHKQSVQLGLFSAPGKIDVWEGKDLKKNVPYGAKLPERSAFRDLPAPAKSKDGDAPSGPPPKQWQKSNPGKHGRTTDVYFQNQIDKSRPKPNIDQGDKEAWKKEYMKTHDDYQDKTTFIHDALEVARKKDGGGATMNDIFHGEKKELFQQEMKGFRGGKQTVAGDIVPVPGALRGFASSDLAKRGEFTSTIRTEQYRELLKSEDKFTKAGQELIQSLGNVPTEEELAATRRSLAPKPTPLLYDLVYEKNMPSPKEMEGKLMRVSRDTLNPTHLSKDRNLGAYKTSNAAHFPPPTEHKKPEFGHKPLIQETFYRPQNAFHFGGATTSH